MQLEQVQVDILMLTQESVLVVRFLKLLVLDPDVSNCSFHLLLHILHILCCPDESFCGLLNLGEFIRGCDTIGCSRASTELLALILLILE